MTPPNKPAPVSETQAWLRDIAARPEWHRAASILREIPADTKNESGLEALRFAALAQAAKSPLEAARHLIEASSHWKDYMLWADAIKGEKHGVQQADRRKGKTKLAAAKEASIKREYDSSVVKYGTVKALARTHDVSEDTIRRIIKKN